MLSFIKFIQIYNITHNISLFLKIMRKFPNIDDLEIINCYYI